MLHGDFIYNHLAFLLLTRHTHVNIYLKAGILSFHLMYNT